MNKKTYCVIILSLSLMPSLHASSWLSKQLGEGSRYAALRTSIVSSQWFAKSPTMQNFAEKHFNTAVISGVSALALMAGYGLFRANQYRNDRNFDRNMTIDAFTEAISHINITGQMFENNPLCIMSTSIPLTNPDRLRPFGSLIITREDDTTHAEITIQDKTKDREWAFTLPRQSNLWCFQSSPNITYPIDVNGHQYAPMCPTNVHWIKAIKLIQDFLTSRSITDWNPRCNNTYQISPPLKVIDLSETASGTPSSTKQHVIFIDNYGDKKMVYPAPSNKPLKLNMKMLTSLLDQIDPGMREDFVVQLDLKSTLMHVQFSDRNGDITIAIDCDGSFIYSYVIRNISIADFKQDWNNIKNKLQGAPIDERSKTTSIPYKSSQSQKFHSNPNPDDSDSEDNEPSAPSLSAEDVDHTDSDPE